MFCKKGFVVILLLLIAPLLMADEYHLLDIKKILSEKYLEVNIDKLDINKIQKNVRKDYIRKTAFELGISLGINTYKIKINTYFKRPNIARMMDRLYPFDRFVFNNNYMPPVIDYQENTMSLNNNKSIMRSTRFIFKKIKKAEIILTPPSWRNYFFAFKLTSNHSINLADYLNTASSPLFKEELDIWISQLDRGFSKGILYIESNFRLALNKMDRDFKGYLLFYMLQDQGIIRPVVIKKSFKEYVLKKDELRIGDSVFRILEANFQIESYLEKIKQQKKDTKDFQYSKSKTWIEE